MTGAKNQKFYIRYLGDGTYTIRPIHTSNKYLQAVGSSVRIYDSSNIDAQKWYIYASGDTYIFINKNVPKQVLAANTETSIILKTYTVTGCQWKIGGNTLGTITEAAYNAGVRAYLYAGTYYYDYTNSFNSVFNQAKTQCSDNRCMNWTQYCEWLPILAEPSLTEFKGMQIGSFLWFFDQVKPTAVWDIKVRSCWLAAMPNVPYLGVTNKFIFRGKLNSAESMGNLMYGYTGRATGFGSVTLYWGGGVAAQGSINNSAVNTPPYYGDSVEDHTNITIGYNTFNSEYPNYPELGYDGIPIEEGILATVADALLF